MKQVFIKSVDGYRLDVNIYSAENPKAVVQLVHGMEEHQGRYKLFAQFLADNGYTVITSDMRGHGKSAKDLGFFAKSGGYKLLIQDQKAITEYIKQNYKGLPVYLFAHSMGTIITRVLLEHNSQDYAKVVLSGYPCYQKLTGVGILLAKLVKLFKGAKYKPKFIENLSVGVFNKQIKNPKTSVDWVCANPDIVMEYIADPLCGIGFTCSAFADLFTLVKLMHKPKRYTNVNASMPLFLLSGENDPCTGGKKGRENSQKVLKKAGFINKFAKNYPNMRHEILNEADNKQVYIDILKFYNKKES